MIRATNPSEAPMGLTITSKLMQVLLPVSIFFILSAVVLIFIDPAIGVWVACTLSMLLVFWMYLGRLLASTATSLRSSINNLQVKNFELIGKVEVAEETCKVKSQFLASMSHEIRTPLSAILGFVELLDDPALPMEEHLEYLRIVRSNSEYLIKVVNDILDVSHLNSGKLTIEPKPTEVAEVLFSILSLLKKKADEKGLDLSIDYWSPIPSVIMIDEGRLRQIVVNLVGNAIKFTSNGSVKVRAGCHPSEDVNVVNLEIVVRDSGIGIEHAERNQLFNMFSQLNTGYLGRSKGTGLGLAISKSLANMMGGDVKLLGSIPGKGSSFVFSCPSTMVAGSELEQTAAAFPFRRPHSVLKAPASL